MYFCKFIMLKPFFLLFKFSDFELYIYDDSSFISQIFSELVELTNVCVEEINLLGDSSGRNDGQSVCDKKIYLFATLAGASGE
mmetsp:Transcript_7446/g.6779  ORF Transcript_7446/g.6779 Transcript_7446/m.6779 type:complete len:83 (+) Transcript_7446:109-357(+)